MRELLEKNAFLDVATGILGLVLALLGAILAAFNDGPVAQLLIHNTLLALVAGIISLVLGATTLLLLGDENKNVSWFRTSLLLLVSLPGVLTTFLSFFFLGFFGLIFVGGLAMLGGIFGRGDGGGHISGWFKPD